MKGPVMDNADQGRLPGYQYLPRGVVEDGQGLIAGMWLKRRHGEVETMLFERPIKRTDPFGVELKDIVVDGRVVENFPVKVFKEINNFTHWGKYAKPGGK